MTSLFPSPSVFPSKDQIAEFLAQAPGKVGKREIARAFGLQGEEDRIKIKQLLREMESEGQIQRRRHRIARADRLPPVVAADITSRDTDGELIAEAVRDAESGPAAKILILPQKKSRHGDSASTRAPGMGDRVLVRVSPSTEAGGPAYVGRVIKILPKAKSQTLGIFRKTPDGGGRLVPIEKKGRLKELTILPADSHDAEDGDLVAVTVSESGKFGALKAKVRERLGNMKSERAVSMIAVHAHQIPHEFPVAALREAELACPLTLKGREDWRELPLLTIDPFDAKDHDDAVHAIPDDDPANEGGFIVTVAIADVAAYVAPESALDREALIRGNSVYFPDRVIPMLPEKISNDLCSLKPNVDRPALAVRMVLSADGRKKNHRFHRIMMRSSARLSYQQAQAAFDGQPDEEAAHLVADVLTPLYQAYQCATRARDIREPLYLDLPERKIVLKADGTVDRVLIPERLEAHKLIEEFMILANVCAAETLEAAHSPLLYRAHDEPSVEKMRNLGEVLTSIGVKLPKAGALKAELFNRILKAVEGSEHQAFVNEVVLRSQAQAEYTSENYGHFGLNLHRYAHFTSPIRRYADVIVHRALISALHLGTDGLPKSTTREHLKKVGEQISAAERRAMAAERDTNDRLIAHFLSDRIGQIFEGRVAGVTRSGLFVKLRETGADGFVPIGSLNGDYFAFDEGSHALRGTRTGETYRLGDSVSVKLIDAAPVAGALTFEMLSDGKRGKAFSSTGKKSTGKKGSGKVAKYNPFRVKKGAGRQK